MGRCVRNFLGEMSNSPLGCQSQHSLPSICKSRKLSSVHLMLENSREMINFASTPSGVDGETRWERFGDDVSIYIYERLSVAQLYVARIMSRSRRLSRNIRYFLSRAYNACREETATNLESDNATPVRCCRPDRFPLFGETAKRNNREVRGGRPAVSQLKSRSLVEEN